MLEELSNLDDLGAELARRARARGLRLIWRAQRREVHHVLVRRGRVESSSVATSAGHGLQLVTVAGRSALGTRDDLVADEAEALFERVAAAASRTEGLGVERRELPRLEPLRAREVPEIDGFRRVALDAVAKRLTELEAEIAGRVPGTRLSLSFRAELDAWRIFREDGTDVLYAMPRCTLGAHATNERGEERHGVSASLFGATPELPWDGPSTERFLKRAERAARLALALPGAPLHPAGSFPLVIDYALAKGLAHEAFGHAAEADGFRSSVLARDGRFRTGERAGAEHVSIIDEPVRGDHAWQPYSANGVKRERVTIVESGRLAEGLSDIWSAGPAGARLTGAARAESFHHAPQVRMTNIRIEVADPHAAPGEFEDYGPEQVRDLLHEGGVLRRHPRVAYLSGYSGGQVNPTTGDFVFNCKAIYGLGPTGIELYKPAIFSGSMFSALEAVREAFGPLRLDAIGYCGKGGQSVPSSGGSHYFLVLDPDSRVRLGGA